MKKLNLKSKKAKIITVSVVIILITCVCAGLNFAGNSNSKESKTISTTKSNITTTVHTTNETTTKPAETTTKKATTIKSTTQKSSSSQKQSNSSGSSKSNGNSRKKTTKKNTTTTKKQTTTKAKSYAMTKTEIRNYALDQIAKIDGTIYTPEFTKNNSGWYTPLIIEPGDSEEEIKEGIRDSVNFVYDKYANGYNVYVENSTYWYATESYDGECKEYNIPCIKVYFLYGQRYTGPPIIEAE